ncbi:hypothetical protein [Chromohalobacter israelensis]|nr:hypothetical protein [Chromohalobacter salexigens]
MRLDEGRETVWLTNIFNDEELAEEATAKDFLQVQIEGGRKVERRCTG